MTPTAKEFLESKAFDYGNQVNKRLEDYMDEYAAIQWNAAIEAAAESAKTKKVFSMITGTARIVVSKQSILKLKK